MDPIVAFANESSCSVTGRKKTFTKSTESVNHAQLPLKTHDYSCHWQKSFQSCGTCDFEGLHMLNCRRAVGLDLDHSLGIFVLVIVVTL